MKVGYFVKDHGETLEDVNYLSKEFSECELDEFEKDYLMEEICNYAWDRDDGWEWLRTGAVLSLVINDIYQGDFEVTVDFDPTFIVNKVKK